MKALLSKRKLSDSFESKGKLSVLFVCLIDCLFAVVDVDVVVVGGAVVGAVGAVLSFVF